MNQKKMKKIRLIDADALHKALYTKQKWVVHRNGKHNEGFTSDQVHFAIDEQPTIEAEPVRHGKWIKADSQQYFRKHYPCFTCSECGYRKDSQKKWDYCPNCGAYMRGDTNE